jgi:outer membrane protein OmpA-like peptidoglycan-associated protein
MAGAAPGGGTQAFASTLTDLMTSLAVIFILLLVVFLKQAHDSGKKTVVEVKDGLSSFLEQKEIPIKQSADDPNSLTVMVGELHLRFPVGRATLNRASREFVDSFFDTFASKVCSFSMRGRIDSITVEGNTDKSGDQTLQGSRKNIAISQQRAFSVMEEGLRSLEDNPVLHDCLMVLTSANGRGSSNPVMINGVYDADQSRRVEIKIRVRPNAGPVAPPPPPPLAPRSSKGKRR